MEPLPEARVAAVYLDGIGREPDALRVLQSVADRAAALVPALVGVSVTVVVDGTPYTLTATAESLQAAGHLDRSTTPDRGEAIEVSDLLDEGAWHLFAATSAAPGVRSSLSLPLVLEDGPAGAIDLYGSDPAAFDDRLASLATAFGVPFDLLVANADLPFETRRQAEQLPGRLSEEDASARAVEALAAQRGWSTEEAARRLADAAERAGVEQSRLVQALLRLDRP
ncbi:GAF domain-containing protein [Angustibacter aerolatus]